MYVSKFAHLQLINEYFTIQNIIYEQLSKITVKDNRKDYWLESSSIINTFENEINSILNNLIEIRNQISKINQFESYQQYSNKLNKTTEHTERDVIEWKNNIQKYIIPLVRDIYHENALELGIESINPWDLDYLENGKIDISYSLQECIPSIFQLLEELDSDFYIYLSQLWLDGYIDIEMRKSKVDFGFCIELPYSKKFFISIYPTNSMMDIYYFIHEVGHGYHNYLKHNLSHYTERNTNNEVNELFAHLFESILIFQLFGNQKDVIRNYLNQLVISIPFNVAIHGFQEKLYTQQYPSAKEKKDLFLDILKKYTHHCVNIEPYEKEVNSLWLMQEQIFSTPFYYIEYSYAKLASLYHLALHSDKNFFLLKQVFSQIKQVFSQGAYLSPNETFKQVVNSGLLLSEEKFIHVSKFVRKKRK
ncbi:M3 family metallopeptidase [Anoxybacillus flavithermus]|uniref:M3 family metallopeptidase n=1 Tax=Anoxybacillus flavithermus TaxID=33934 RepID=UPI0030B8D747